MDVDYEDADTISVDTLVLEERIIQDWEQEISELNKLSQKVRFLHTSLLYYRDLKSRGSVCYEAWKVIVKRIGGSPNTWKELGYALGISHEDMNYIECSRAVSDPTDLVLKVFRQNENRKGTLDKITDALVKMERYDILKSMQQPLMRLAEAFTKQDSGYHSDDVISYTKFYDDLPPFLNKKIILSRKDPIIQRPALIDTDKTELKNDKPILFLTYMEDGLRTALDIKSYINTWTEISGVTIITLNDRRDEVIPNPEKFIREYFEKADFVVPIVTSSYLQEIKSHSPMVPSTSDNLDCKYVSFIYNLIINHYIHASGCLNKKVRSVLPNGVNIRVVRDITMYPDLMPWTLEKNFNEQFQVFLKKEYKS